MDIDFTLCIIIQYYVMLFTFDAQIAPAMAIGDSFSWLLCPVDMYPFVCVFFKAPLYFLAL